MPRLTSQQLHTLSRRPAVLVRATAVLVGGALLVAWVLWGMVSVVGPGKVRLGTMEDAVEAVRDAEVLRTEEGLREWGEAPWPGLPAGEDAPGDRRAEPVLAWVEREVLGRLAEAGLEERGGALLAAYAMGLHGPAADRARWRAELEGAARQGRPFAAELAGDVALLDGEPAAGREWFRRELEVRRSRHAAGRLVLHALRRFEDTGPEPLRGLRNEPAVWRALGPGLQLEVAARLRDWGAMAGAAIRADYLESRAVDVILGMAVAAVWFVIVVQFAGFGRGQWLLYGVSLLLGVLSATATIYAVVVQETVLGVAREGEDLVTGLIHYVAGVALREELLKLLFFLPLLPWLLRRGRAIDALVAAGLVGLGFALNENLGYYGRHGSGVAIGRLLTANIAHVAWTGCTGFALFRVAWFKGRHWDDAVATFLTMVLAHGLYNSFIGVPELAMEFGIVTAVILAFSAWRYFDLAEDHYRPSGLRVSVLAVFVLGTALMVGLTMNIVLFGRPTFPAAIVFLASTVQLLPVAFIFIHRFRNA